MITKVLFTSEPPPGAVARLQRGGLLAAACSPGKDAAGMLQSWHGSRDGQVLVVGPLGEGPAVLGDGAVLSWDQVAAASQHSAQPPPPSTVEQVAQAVVAFNHHHQQPQQQQQQLVVGYVMKASREAALAADGLVHLLPADGMCFAPLDVDAIHAAQQQQQQQHQPAWQQPRIDLLLHKGSDELVPLPPDARCGGADGADAGAVVGVRWSDRLLSLQAWLKQQQQQQRSLAVVDPFPSAAKVLDRLLLARLLEGLQALQLPGGARARAPRFCEVSDFSAPGMADRLAAAGLQPPCIIKPRVACGVAHSHSMALLLAAGGLPQLAGVLPAPAVVQEFVNHGGLQFKVYVLGRHVFATPRASIPDIQPPGSGTQQQQQQDAFLLFDSLASLPTQLPAHLQQQQQQQQPAPPQAVLEALAAFLRQQLGLTLFGFDVVLPTARGGGSPAAAAASGSAPELVVVDVNYFPNYRGGGPNTPALFRAALRQAWQQQQEAA